MKRQFGRYKLFAAAVTFYIVGALFYGCFEYYREKKLALKALDRRLLATVSSAEHLLQQELRDNIAGVKPITPDEDFFLSLKLQELAEAMDVVYIYSLIKKEDGFFFISSNPEPEELAALGKEYEVAFLSPYPDAPDILNTVFETGQFHYSEYKDKWGSFRAVFFPFTDTKQNTYVIGVDVDLADLQSIANVSLFKALFYSLLLGLMVFPLIYAYIRSMRQSYRQSLDAISKNSLTGLPNQRCLENRLTNTPEDHLLLIEIENFDYVSSVLGVAPTDALVLRLVYGLLELKVANIEHCEWFHLAENRFALFSTHPASDNEVKAIVSAIFNVMTHANTTTNIEENIPLVVRMGGVRSQSNAFMFAGMALLHAKKTNQSFVSYESSLNLPNYYQRYIRTFNLLVDALKNERVTVYFQPILDVSNGQVVKYEALARILDENGRVVSSPDEFMPIAYQSRLCHKLTRVVLDKVLEAVRSRGDVVVSINLSVKDLFDQKTRDYIIHRIRRSHLGEQIEFELLEQQVITNYRTAAAYIKQLKSCVASVGMDDLGKLYSNFDRLFALPLDFVKIDGSIVEAMERDSDAKSLIEGIVSFARQKGIHVIAEHCYNQNVCDMVVLMNVDLLQGFHIGPPSEDFVSQTVEPLRAITSYTSF